MNLTAYCECETPVFDAFHDFGCRRCGRPIDFTPPAPDEAAAPRCAVCGGPEADGSGCEYCPRIEPQTTWELRNLLERECEAGRAAGLIASTVRDELARRGEET